MRKLSTIRAPQDLTCDRSLVVTKGQDVINNNSHTTGVK